MGNIYMEFLRGSKKLAHFVWLTLVSYVKNIHSRTKFLLAIVDDFHVIP
jgi:hypothetical protein